MSKNRSSALKAIVLLLILSSIVSLRYYAKELTDPQKLRNFLKTGYGIDLSYDKFEFDRRVNHWKIKITNLRVRHESFLLKTQNLHINFAPLGQLISQAENHKSKIDISGFDLAVDNDWFGKPDPNLDDKNFIEKIQHYVQLVTNKQNFLFSFFDWRNLFKYHDNLQLKIKHSKIKIKDDFVFDIVGFSYQKSSLGDDHMGNDHVSGFLNIRNLYDEYNGVTLDFSRKHANNKTNLWNIKSHVLSIQNPKNPYFKQLTDTRFSGTLDLENMSFVGNIRGQNHDKKNFSSKINTRLVYTEEDNLLDVQLIRVKIQNKKVGDWKGRLNYQTQKLFVEGKQTPLSTIKIFLPQLSEDLGVDKIKGFVNRIVLDYDFKTEQITEFKITAKKLGANLNSDLIKSFRDFSVNFHYKNDKSTVRIYSPKATFQFTKSPNQTIVQNLDLDMNLNGALSAIEAVEIPHTNFILNKGKVTLQTDFSLDSRRQLNQLTLHLETEKIKVLTIRQILSFQAFNEETYAWIDKNLLAGSADKLSLKIKTKKSPSSNKYIHDDLSLRIKSPDLTIRPYDGWPVLRLKNSALTYQNDILHVKTKKVLDLKSGLQFSDASFKIHPQDNLHYLDLDGFVRSRSAQASTFIQSSPIPQLTRLETFFNSMKMRGNITGKLSLKIPLSLNTTKQTQSEFNFNFKNLFLSYKDWILKRATGNIQMKNNSLNSSLIKAKIFRNHNPIQFRFIQPDSTKRLKLVYTASIKTSDWLPKHASGNLRLWGSVKFPHKQTNHKTFTSTFNSDFRGVKLDLPTILKKDKQSAKRFRTTMEHTTNSLHLDVDFKDLIKVKMNYKTDQNKIEFFKVRIGRKVYKKSYKGSYVIVNMPKVHLQKWLDVADSFKQEEKQASFDFPNFPMPRISIKTDQLRFSRFSFEDVKLEFFKSTDKNWMGFFNSSPTNIYITNKKDSTLSIFVDKLQIRSSTTPTIQTKISATDQCPSLSYKLQYFPHIVLNIKELSHNNSPPVKLSGTGSLIHNVLTFDNLELRSSNHTITMSKLLYTRPSSDQSVTSSMEEIHTTPFHFPELTQSNVDIKAKSLQKLLLFLGFNYPSYIAENLRLNAKLNWVGAPWCFNERNLTGSAEIDTDSGVFKGIEPGLARVLSILNLKILLQRLALEKDALKRREELEKQGMSFDTIEAKVQLNDGLVNVEKLRIDSDIAVIKIDGQVNTLEDNYDLDVNVKPEIIPTLVALAAIFGGPVTGFLTFVYSQILSMLNFDDHLLSYTFDVKGDIENLELEKKINEEANESDQKTSKKTSKESSKETPNRSNNHK